MRARVTLLLLIEFEINFVHFDSSGLCKIVVNDADRVGFYSALSRLTVTDNQRPSPRHGLGRRRDVVVAVTVARRVFPADAVFRTGCGLHTTHTRVRIVVVFVAPAWRRKNKNTIIKNNLVAHDAPEYKGNARTAQFG